MCLGLVAGCGIDAVGTLPVSSPPQVDAGPPVVIEEAGAADAPLDAPEDVKPGGGYRVVGLGDGNDGVLDVTSDDVVNRYAAITGDVPAGSSVIPVGAVAPAGRQLKGGDLVLVWQTAAIIAPAPPNDSSTLDLAASPIGRWELARLSGVTPTAVTLDVPTTLSFTSPGAQLVHVREYTSVQISAGAKLTAVPWDGARGGIVAFLAIGTVTNLGEIDVVGAGFRAGLAKSVTVDGCTGPDGVPASGFARKGEGVAGYGGGGFGNRANGGGGGDCHNGGGAGGGNGGVGGHGGLSYDNGRDVGGRGGSPLSYSLVTRLTLGGGGGAGEGDDSDIPSGNPGGGAVFIRAGALAGAGTITANGASSTQTSTDAGGGGGAGGSIYLRFKGAAACGGVSASGGDGGNTGNDNDGPGGGGGGGRVLLQAQSAACVTAVRAGKAGLTPVPDNRSATPAVGNEPGFVGIVEPKAGAYCPLCSDEP